MKKYKLSPGLRKLMEQQNFSYYINATEQDMIDLKEKVETWMKKHATREIK